MNTNSAGNSSTTTHAPAANFATTITITVIPVAKAPSPLTSIPRATSNPDAVRHQCPTIPACDKVNAINAPTANKGIRRSVTPPNKISKSPAKSASAQMPCENTSRRPQRLPKRLHSVTNGLDASQSRTPRGKRLGQDPHSHQLQRRGLPRRRLSQSHHRYRMSPRSDHPIQPNHDHHRQSPDKKIIRSLKRRPR